MLLKPLNDRRASAAAAALQKSGVASSIVSIIRQSEHHGAQVQSPWLLCTAPEALPASDSNRSHLEVSYSFAGLNCCMATTATGTITYLGMQSIRYVSTVYMACYATVDLQLATKLPSEASCAQPTRACILLLDLLAATLPRNRLITASAFLLYLCCSHDLSN